MQRREFLGRAAALAALALPGLAHASAGSGQSSAGSGQSSAASGDSSAGSGDSTQASNSGDASAQSSAESSADAGMALLSTTLVGLGVNLTAGAIVLIVLLSANARRKRKKEEELLRTSMLGLRHDLGGVLALAASSPAELELLVAEASVGQGESLDRLARATRLDRARVARAVVDAWRPVHTEVEATQLALRVLATLAPDLEPAPDAVAGWLDQLRREARAQRVDVAHQQLATWMGVPVDTLGPVPDLPDRVALHADPLAVADALAVTIAARFPAEVDARVAALDERVRRIDAGLDVGLFG